MCVLLLLVSFIVAKESPHDAFRESMMNQMFSLDINSQIGSCMPLAAMRIGTIIHNIEINPGQGGKLVRAAGTSAKLLKEPTSRYVLVRMPSGVQKLIDTRCRATIGTVSNPGHGAKKLRKAGQSRWLGRRPVVRGVAMNPVDHPHGGGEGEAKVVGAMGGSYLKHSQNLEDQMILRYEGHLCRLVYFSSHEPFKLEVRSMKISAQQGMARPLIWMIKPELFFSLTQQVLECTYSNRKGTSEDLCSCEDPPCNLPSMNNSRKSFKPLLDNACHAFIQIGDEDEDRSFMINYNYLFSTATKQSYQSCRAALKASSYIFHMCYLPLSDVRH
ncbi:60S ribosomal protein L2, mitochondrial [Vitis vinifera]|uniref:60S ribosomal protein L2, mitochondrial n=1 Tax=Vitis vinifera TaxID=29760 RepID=A0A438BSS3_VITVI|nr:60S ribosomal protein L2, mitochondrial [Vitis vinifera]